MKTQKWQMMRRTPLVGAENVESNALHLGMKMQFTYHATENQPKTGGSGWLTDELSPASLAVRILRSRCLHFNGFLVVKQKPPADFPPSYSLSPMLSRSLFI